MSLEAVTYLFNDYFDRQIYRSNYLSPCLDFLFIIALEELNKQVNFKVFFFFFAFKSLFCFWI